jgi:hypothetical protein
MKSILIASLVLGLAAWEIVWVRRRLVSQASVGTITLEFARKRSAYLWRLWVWLTIMMAGGVIVELTR